MATRHFEQLALAYLVLHGEHKDVANLGRTHFTDVRQGLYDKIIRQLLKYGHIDTGLLFGEVDKEEAVELGLCMDLCPTIESAEDIADGLRKARFAEDLSLASKKAVISIEQGEVDSAVSLLTEVVNRKESKARDPYANVDNWLAGNVRQLVTGMRLVDEKDPIMEGEYIIVAGRPSCGKTALMSSISYFLVKNGMKVGMISAEMPAEQIIMRMISMATNVPLGIVRTANMSPRERERASEFMENNKKLLNLYDGSREVSQICNHIRRNQDIKIWFVDYIQLLASSMDSDNEHSNISKISKMFKSVAIECGVSIFMASQLSRVYERRNTMIPQLSDLRGSGSLEEDADRVWFLVPQKHLSVGLIDVKKNRNGALYAFRMFFDAPTTMFANLDTEFKDESELFGDATAATG